MCDGDNSSCSGCIDPYANNTDITATRDCNDATNDKNYCYQGTCITNASFNNDPQGCASAGLLYSYTNSRFGI